MPMVLVPLNGDRPVPLDKAILFFGRGADCDVVLTNSRKVSRKHCCVAQIDDYFVVRDLGSMNGIRVNDRDVSADEVRLNVGDELWIGDVGFRLQPLDTRAAASLIRRSKKNPADKIQRAINPDFLSDDFPVPEAPEFDELEKAAEAQDEFVEFIPEAEILGLDEDEEESPRS